MLLQQEEEEEEEGGREGGRILIYTAAAASSPSGFLSGWESSSVYVSYHHRPSCAFLFCLWCHVVVHHVCCSFEYIINYGWVGTGISHLYMYVCVLVM